MMASTAAETGRKLDNQYQSVYKKWFWMGGRIFGDVRDHLAERLQDLLRFGLDKTAPWRPEVTPTTLALT